MVDLIGVTKIFHPGTVNERRALDEIDLHMEEGDFVTIIGSNGAGKSTMLNAIAGVWPIDSGAILLDGEDISHLPEHMRASFLPVSRHVVISGAAAKTAPPKQVIQLMEKPVSLILADTAVISGSDTTRWLLQ